LSAIAGGVVVTSHDRWFLDRIATHILAFESDSKLTFFDGTVRRRGGREHDARCNADDRS
jgi:ATPase subunit of ABC transporter with duplicated ATPase domains